MKQMLFIFFMSLFVCSLVFGGAVVKDFQGEAGMNQVKLKWVVSAESDLKGYKILRSYDGTTFQEIALIEPKSESTIEKSYIYIDRTVFKSNGHTWYYKLQIVNMTDGSATDYDQVVIVSPQVSSARQTWGSIKAMFR
jgi:hypothetical protein